MHVTLRHGTFTYTSHYKYKYILETAYPFVCNATHGSVK